MEEGYETIYYLEAENGRRRFAVVKFFPRIVRYLNFKAVRSGNFQFAITNETILEEKIVEIEEKLKEIIRSRSIRKRVLNAIYDILAEVLIDGLTFELTVEESLYLAKLIEKYVLEDHDLVREMRFNALFEEKFGNRDDPSIH